MQIKLINEYPLNTPALERILYNRGIQQNDFYHYINTTDEDICDFNLLGEENLKLAFSAILKAIKENKETLVIVDSDCDGFTSAAALLNYLHKLFPSFVENHIHWRVHNGKQHGLTDQMDFICENNFSLIICPDSASNDYEAHKILKEKNIDVIILDHHEAPSISNDAIVINNQLCDYPNKFLSGAGIVWQFCRYIDSLNNTNYANDLLDLVALGLSGDMMSLKSFETKHLINKGFKEQYIINPFIYGMWNKNRFKLGDKITSWGAVFYIVPLVNAICRSGTIEDKTIVFRSMLEYEAFTKILSNKRGHTLGQTESILDQALRTVTNVKNRQTKAQDEGMQFLEKIIAGRGLLQHQVLVCLIEPGQIDPNIAGLCANKIMAKYQRPCCVLTKMNSDYAGSARGCDMAGITEFKDLCENTGLTTFTAGHQGAFGLGIKEDKVESFVNILDEKLSGLDLSPTYYVDYYWNENELDEQAILDIADLGYLWGKDMPESVECVHNIKIFKEMITIMASNTLKITLPCSIPILKFRASEEEIEKLISENGYVEINAIVKCNKNEWNGHISGQLFLEDFEIIDKKGWAF